MDNWSPTGAAFARLGFDPTGVRRSSFGAGGDPTGVRSTDWNTRSGDPTGVGQSDYGRLGRLGEDRGFDPLLDFGITAMQAQIAKKKEAEAQFNFFGNQQPQSGGQGMATLGGSWAGVDQWDATIQAAARKYGVPANLIKAVMKLESGGDPGSVSVAGATGPMQVMPGIWNGSDGWNVYDPNENIMLGAYVLKTNYDQYGSWEQATRHYLGIGTDAYGTSDDMYWNRVSQDWNALNSQTAGGTAGTGYNPGSPGGGLGSMFPASQTISQEYAAYGGPDLYDYGRAYGLDGSQHTGLDVAMPRGSPYYAPMGGQVMCAGTGRGVSADGTGCGAFNNYDDNGNISSGGRVEILLDNGVMLIYGHSQGANVQVGQRVTAGTLLGTSGSMNGPHVHLEARVRDANGGWRLVDPRTVIGGGSFAPGSNGGYTPLAPQSGQAGNDWGSMMMNFLLTPGYHW